MLNTWLNSNERNPCPYSRFQVIDLEQVNELSPEIRSYLIDLLRKARFDPWFLEAVSEELGWKKTKDLIVARQVPTTITAKRGEFGEVLTNAILEQFHSYRIPVYKLRFKITANQSLPSTDTLALKIGREGSIVEVCFVESKLRTYMDYMAAIDGCNQLQNDYTSKFPDILHFVAQRLYDRNDPLFKSFTSYMRDRSDTTDKDTFRLGLCWEQANWSESVLENLEENRVDLPRLTVHVIHINGLLQLTDRLFSELGITEISDND